MTIEEIKELVEKNPPELTDAQVKALKEYDTEQHKVFDKSIRPLKEIIKPSLGADGRPMKTATGLDILKTSYEEVNRISIPFQKLVVRRRKDFMNLKNIELTTDSENTNMLDEVVRIRKKNKYVFKISDIATKQMSELQAAEYWYIDAITKEIRLRVLSPSTGDILKPIFDAHGDLSAVIRSYKVITPETGKELDYIDYFDNTQSITFDENMNEIDGYTVTWGKIPLILYGQNKSEWNDSQPMIERYASLLSNFSDTNDYNGSPIMTVNGKINGFAEKGERGKVLMLEKEAKVNYLSWDSAPESIALEFKELKEGMHAFTNTPNMTLAELKGLGASGAAFDRIFIDAQLTAEDKLTGSFGEGLQRSVNLVCAMAKSLNGSLPDDLIDVNTESYKFDDFSTYIKDLSVMAGGSEILSVETIVKSAASKMGFDPAIEWEKYQIEHDTLTVEDAEE